MEDIETFQNIYSCIQFKWANCVSLTPIVEHIGKMWSIWCVSKVSRLQTTVAHSCFLYEKRFNYNQTIYDSVHNLVSIFSLFCIYFLAFAVCVSMK